MSGKGSKNSIDFAFRRKQSPIARNEQCIGLSASLGDVRRITTPADNDSGDTTSEGGASYRTESGALLVGQHSVTFCSGFRVNGCVRQRK